MKYFLQFSLIVCLCFFLTNLASAQDPDTLDVPQGFETLNLAVESDTTENGEPKNPNRVYRLQRDGYYLFNGTIRGLSGIPLRVVGAEGEGARPVLVYQVDQDGNSARLFRPNEDGEFKNLYLTSMNTLAFFTSETKNTIRLEKDNGKYVIDNCYFDYQQQSYFRMNSDGQKLFITNSMFRNCGDLVSPTDSKMIDTRGNFQDSIVAINSTFYGGSHKVIRSNDKPFNYLKFDHCTFVNFGEEGIEMRRVLDADITNNIMINLSYEGEIMDDGDPADTVGGYFVELDSLQVDTLRAEDERNIVIKNNVWGISPELISWYDSVDSLHAPEFLNSVGQAYVRHFDNVIVENNISEVPNFTDVDPVSGGGSILAYAQHRLATNYDNVANPSWYFDRNGVATFAEDFTTYGLGDNEYEFDYSISDAAYTHAENGFPAGDLNWFPEKKAEWEAQATNVEVAEGFTPKEFNLSQNYPNPFNPTTSISYTLSKNLKVTLDVYNVLGQKVRTLIDNELQKAGEHVTQWNGRDESGYTMPSGMYFYRLSAGDQVQQRKMVLLK